MLEVLYGVIIAAFATVIGVGIGFTINPKQSKPIQIPEIKIVIPEIVVKSKAETGGSSEALIKLAEKYESAIEKSKGIRKAEEMTEEYADLNSLALKIMEGYLTGGEQNVD